MFFGNRRSCCLFAVAALGLLSACDDRENATVSQGDVSQALALYENMFIKYANNPEPEQRITFPSGFSFVPPQAENWIEGPRKPEPDLANYGLVHRLGFAKLLPQDEERGPHTALANVFTMRVTRQNKSVDPQEFMRFRMRTTVASDKVVKNSKIVSQKAELNDTLGYQCFRYDAVFENLGVAGFQGVPFKVDYHVMECIAPSREFVVRLQYGQMTPPDVEPIDITREGEVFLKSLRFSSGPQG
jgi:hypothetical protein